MTTHITIRKPDDWHCHMRDGEMLKAVSTRIEETAVSIEAKRLTRHETQET